LTWVITIRPLPSHVPEEVRVRRLLKIVLRAFALECTAVRDAKEQEKREAVEPMITPVKKRTRQRAA
jgi:hypothetical protein